VTGTLYLVPVPLDGETPPGNVLPPPVLETLRGLRHFVVEEARSARAFLKRVGMPVPLQTLFLAELNEHTPETALPLLLRPLLEGHDVGLISEAGCPAVADPGAQLAALAQARLLRVVPCVGPSSLLLALMASGLNGQRFAFHGYLPAQAKARDIAIGRLEKVSRDNDETQLFIETPYRNMALFSALLRNTRPETRLCLATDIGLATEDIRTRTIAEWKHTSPPNLNHHPTVFLVLACSGSPSTWSFLPRKASK
jgi:16S rRNA (cytidine1402-2'-O)-methyltransferase